MSRVKVNVTQEHINNGKQYWQSACPIALAVKDALEIPDVRVSGYGILLTDKDGNWRYHEDKHSPYWGRHEFHCHMPRRARTFMRKFDAGDCVKPFTFILDTEKEGSRTT